MTFAEPVWLALLGAAPIVWWLHRRITAPREVPVASVEALRGAVTDAASARPRRRLDVELWASLLAVVCLALAASGPSTGSPFPSVLVVVDDSASGAHLGDDGLSLRESAMRDVLRAVESFGGDTGVEVLALGSAGPMSRIGAGDWPGSGDEVPVPPLNLSADDLPGSLASAFAFARQNGYPGLILVTDRDVGDQPGLIVAGPPSAPAPDAGIVDVVLDGDRALVSVVRHGDGPSAVDVLLPNAVGHAAVPALGSGDDPLITVVARAPEPGQWAKYSVGEADATDAYIQNDERTVRRVGGVRSVRVTNEGSGGTASLRALLEVLGIDVETSTLAHVDLEIVIGGPPTTPHGADPPRIHLAPSAGECAEVALVGDAGVVTGAQLSASGVLERALPDPATTMRATGRLERRGADPLGAWRDRRGVLAAVFARHAVIAIDGEHAGTTWTSDASYPVLVAACLEQLAGGPDRLESLSPLAPTEAYRQAPPPPPIDPAAVPGMVRSAADDRAATPWGGPLAAAGATLLAAATLLAVMRARRFSGGAATSRTAG